MASLSATPAILDLNLYAGDGVTIAFEFTEAGEPWPTLGTWEADIRATDKSEEVIANFGVIVDDEAGLVTLSLSGEQVRDLGTSAVYDLQQVIPGAEPRTWYRGNIKVGWDVTRA